MLESTLRRALGIVAVFVASAMSIGCAGGVRDLEFRELRSGNLILSKHADGRFPHAAWSAFTLAPVPSLDVRSMQILAS